MKINRSYVEVLGESGAVLRRSGDAPTGNRAVDATFDNLIKVDRFVRDVLGRRGWDNKDGPLRGKFTPGLGVNATFDISGGTALLGVRQGADIATGSLGFSPGIVGHEVGHGFDYSESERDRGGVEAVAVQESFADVMGMGVDDDWVLGNEIPGGKPSMGSDYRDLRNPHGRKVSETKPENFNELMNYAAVLVADAIGKSKTLQIWYHANLLLPTKSTGQTHPTTMADFAAAAIKAAGQLHGPAAAEAVKQAYAVTEIYPGSQKIVAPSQR